MLSTSGLVIEPVMISVAMFLHDPKSATESLAKDQMVCVCN